MPGTCQDSIGILLQWPVFLEEPFLGKTPAVHLSKESHQEICPHQDPTKKKTLLQDAGENLPWVPEPSRSPASRSVTASSACRRETSGTGS